MRASRSFSVGAVADLIGVVAAYGLVFAAAATWAQGPMGGGRGAPGGPGGSERRDTFADHYRGSAPAAPPALTLHGGQYFGIGDWRYEVVYMPLQTRIYVYDKLLKPQSAREIQAEMSLRFPEEKKSRRIPFQYLDVPRGPGEQDYLVAVFDIAQLKEKDTPITFLFSNPLDREHPTASFTPVFTSASVRPYVAQVLATTADTDAVTRQRTCPVCGEPLGVKRPLLKLLIAEYPLFVCDRRCVAAVRESPKRYLPRTPPGR
ncbi:MAG: hypothetical protein ABFC63_10515 [Thermoguttaceae bacterium]